MRRYEIENAETDSIELLECDENVERMANHFESAYKLKPSEKYEVNHYSYETDRYGRIKRCEGTLRLEEGKRNTAHQTRAGGEYRLENDEGGHLIAKRFGGSEKIDNIVPMDHEVNRHEYKDVEDGWAAELKKGNNINVKILCRYEKDSARPIGFHVKYIVVDQQGFSVTEQKYISNKASGGD